MALPGEAARQRQDRPYSAAISFLTAAGLSLKSNASTRSGADFGSSYQADRPFVVRIHRRGDRLALRLSAIATAPRLLLLDEIAGGLTEGECLELVATIRGVAEQRICDVDSG